MREPAGTPDSRVRVGIVGTSPWTERMYLTALTSHPGAALVAICGRRRDRAQAMADKYGIPQVFTDYREMLQRAGLQALVVASPDDLHYPITMEALDYRLHVLCEKPLASTGDQARAMYEKAQAMGVRHLTLFTYRWLPAYRYLRDLIDEGYIGRCYDCQFQWFTDYGRSGRYDWRFDGALANGVLGDLGSHLIDLARWYVGDIANVSAHLATVIERRGADGTVVEPTNDSVVLTVEFMNQAHGAIQISGVAQVGDGHHHRRIVLHDESGTLELDVSPTKTELRGARRQEGCLRPLPIPVPDDLWAGPPAGDPLDVMVKQSVGPRLFLDVILDNRPVAPSFYEGWKAQEVVDAALLSHQTGCRIPLPAGSTSQLNQPT